MKSKHVLFDFGLSHLVRYFASLSLILFFAACNKASTQIDTKFDPGVDADAPIALSVSLNSLTYGLNSVIQVFLRFDEPVYVTSSPRIKVALDTGEVWARYVSGDGTRVLTFEYDVQQGDGDADGVRLADTVDLEGAVIADKNGNKYDGFIFAPSASLSIVDTVAPEFYGVSAVSDDVYGTGDHLDFVASFSKDVFIEDGTPSIVLDLDSGRVQAQLEGGNGTPNLRFRYTIQESNFDNDGIMLVTPKNLNGARIRDHVGNVAPASFVPPAMPNARVDAIHAFVVSATAPAAGMYSVGNNLDFSLTFSEPVFVTGSPELPLTLDTGAATASVVSGNGSNTLVFRYTVQAGQADANGIVVGAGLAFPSGAAIRDAAGNSMNGGSLLGATAGLLIDGGPPVVTNVTTARPALYNIGSHLEVSVTFNEAVFVSGVPRLPVTFDTGLEYADYHSGSGTATLVFRKTIDAGERDTNGVLFATSLEDHLGSSILDVAGNAAVMSIGAVNTTTVLVDGIAPQITSIGLPANQTYKIGDLLTFSVTFDDVVTLTGGSPRLVVDVGGATRYAAYVIGSGGTSVTFQYLVAEGDEDIDGISISPGLDLNGSALRDANGNNVSLALPATLTSGIRIDGVRPVVQGISSTSADGTYTQGASLNVRVSFSEAIVVTPTPMVSLNTTGSAAFVSGSGAMVDFTYLVAAGESISDLNVTALTAANQFRDSAGNTAVLTLPAGNNLADNKNIVIDATPVASNISPAAFNEDTEAIISLSYSDVESQPATACAVTGETNATETQSCACAVGVCTVGVTALSNYNGSASFSYTVTVNGLTSNVALANLSITAVDDAPVASNITPATFNEDTQSIITLSYSDIESHAATACSVSAEVNVTETQACACAAGVCTVGVTGLANTNGPGSFDFTVTANGLTSNTAAATLSIIAVDDAPVAASITPAAFNEDTQSIITLAYADTELHPATSCSVTGESNVTETQVCACAAGVCTVGVTGLSNFNGSASFDFTVTANGLTSNVAPAALFISAVDDAPVAVNITPAAFNEDTQAIITLSYNDVEAHLATSCSVTSEANITETQGCACAAGTCTVGVTGLSNFNGAASFAYTVTANGLISNSATATLTVSPVDDAPVASNITPAAFSEDTQSIITLSYTDIESDAATSCSVTGETNVTETQACACAAGVCTVGVTGLTNTNGAASFTYAVTANGLTSNAAVATLSISAVDDAPVAASITPAAFNEDTQAIITLSYTDTELDAATSCSVTGETNVSETQTCACAAGVCTVGVTGLSNFNGSASFTYTVTANGLTSNPATATLSISAIDDAPVAADIAPAAFNEDTQSIITLSYTDTEADAATSCSVTGETNVSETQTCACADGVCTVGVTGLSNFNGSASFDFTVTANGLTSNVASATLSISAVDDAPVALSITPAAFNEDTQSIITLSYTDTELNAATSCSVTGETNVTETQVCACAAGVCTVGVTGLSNYNGSAGFIYTVTANGLISNTASASLSITAVDDAPVAIAISPAAFNEDTQSVITISYTDIESDSATSCSVTGETNVTETQVCVCAAGVCTVGITGLANTNGPASFDFTVTANGLTSNVANASLSILAVDDAPVAANITPAAFNEDTQAIITLSYTDTESDAATSCSVTGETNITETQICSCAAGVCTVGVTGLANVNGSASFSYTVTANGLASSTASAALSITAIDDAPVANFITPAAFPKNEEEFITLSYSDVENHLATSCSLSSPSGVTESTPCACDVMGVCRVGVTSLFNYTGGASFEYTVTTNGLTSAAALASLTIINTNTPPVANDIAPVAFNEDSQSVITLSYSDIDTDLAVSCSVASLANVTETQACACAGGVCTVGVTGALNYNGAASFAYTVTANGQLSNVASATLSITPVDDAPVTAAVAAASFNEDTQSLITLSYSDVEGNPATSCVISSPSNVTETQACACAAGVCTVGVTGVTNFNGPGSFSFTVAANGLTSNASLASFTVLGVDDAPVASNVSPAMFDEDTQSLITLAYTDTESDPATSCSVTGESNVTETLACSCVLGVCTVGVTGLTNYNGAGSFSYTVTANGLVSNAATASLTIAAVDDAPVATNITPAAFNEDTAEVITLAYTDVESHVATICTVTGETNVVESTPCACAAGVCTVGVTGVTNYNGAASFNYTVSANGLTSNVASATLSITASDDAPVAADIAPVSFNEDTQSIITLSYTDVESNLATICSVTSEANVTETQACACAAGVCTVGVTGVANFNGSASFSYTITANGLTSNAATATLSVSPVDDAPVASNISPAAFNEDTQSLITLAYTDVESDQAATCSVADLTNVSETQACACAAGICTVGVTGLANTNGAASFTFTVTANGLTSNVATATLAITAVDDAPVAANIAPAAFNEDTQSIVTLSYTDTELNAATSCSVTGETNITETQVCACAAGVCTVGVTGLSNFNGSASFTYTVTANGLTSNAASAALSITPVDDAPVASNISPAAFNEDTQSIITLAYTDVESDLAVTCTVAGEANVTETEVCACAAGVCTVGVTGTSNFNGAASFSFTVTANGLTSNFATATLSVTAVDDAPVASNITPAAFNEDTQSIITLSYTDTELNPATSCSVTSEVNITETQTCACAAGVCTVGVTGLANYNGSASFAYSVTANGLTSNTASATLAISPVDDAPVAANIAPTAFNEDTQAIITLSYTDTESDAATSCSVTGETNVTETQACVCAAGVCTVGVTGLSNFNGVASFTYTVTANGLASNSATASLTVTAVDDAPVASNITPASFNEDTEALITLAYTDADSDLATVCTVTAETSVTETTPCACVAGVCRVGVTGSTNFNGAASFAFSVTANGLISNTATASLSIDPVDDAPVAVAITPAAFSEDTQGTITLQYTDVESNLATTCSVTGEANVTETVACACAAGVCTVGVTGLANFNGPASFNYSVTANGLTSNTVSASLTISSVDDAPVAANITPASFNEDAEAMITLAYTDVESDAATLCSVTGETNVTETTPCACAAGICTVGVTGFMNYNGPASFAFTVTANGLTSNSATATLSITAVDNAPIAANVTPAAFNEDTQAIVTLAYSDVEGDSATVCSVTGETNVTETQACACAAGVCTVGVTGLANFNGGGSFSYTVTANGQTSNLATATLTISPVDDAPVASNITPAAFNEDAQSIITLSYTDVESDQATACSVTGEVNVSETQVCACAAGVCTVGVTGLANFSGAASFDFSVTANGLTSNVAVATLSISAVNDAPVASNVSPAALNEDTQSIITLAYTDLESDLATACSVSGLTNVTETQSCACSLGTCSVGVTGATNFNGAASFSFTVTAAGQVSNAAVSSLTITAVDDAPVANFLTPPAFNKNEQSIITLMYTDVENDNAASCSLSNLAGVTETQACSCDVLGVCTVGVTGNFNFSGAASFDYTVTANGLTSNAATASLTIIDTNTPPAASNISPLAFNEDVPSTVTLSYSDIDGNLASSCSVTDEANITESTLCSCDGAGVCTVGVTGTLNYFGAASFNYTVTANGQSSNQATATLSITSVDDAPVASNISPAAFNEDTQSIITLSYTDVEAHQATSCVLTGTTSVTETQACACAAGTCSVGVTGNANFNGSANFTYTVTANGLTSNVATASLAITNVNDAPVTAAITPAAFPEDTQTFITLSYTDADSDLADVCGVANLTNVTETTPCACDGGGVCTVGVTGIANYSGAASFNFTVTANGQVSNASLATLSVTAVDDAPVASNLTPASFDQDTQSIITLSYTDVEGHQATTCALTSVTNVTETQACACAAGTCTVGVTGTPAYFGAASFTYTVTGNGLASNAATANFTINQVANPTITNVSKPADGTYKLGQALDFTATFSFAVNVAGGVPRIPITLTTGTVYATYVSGSGSTNLLFRYTVGASDEDRAAGGITLVSPLDLNGATIRSVATNANSALTFTAPTTTGVHVDGIVPTISSVSAPANGNYSVGAILDFTVNFTEAVSVSNTPRIQINLGVGGPAFATYVSGSGTSSLVFRYTVATGHLDTDGIALVSPIDLNGTGTIADLATNAATLTYTAPSTTGILVDGILPTIVSVTPPANATYASGANLDFTVAFSEAVTVTNSPRIQINLNSGTVFANYFSGSGSSSLVFRYTVASGNNDPDGIALVSPVSLNTTGTIRDGASNNATLTFTAPSTSLVRVDALAPTISSVTISNSTYKIGSVMNFDVNFNEVVTVTNSPQIQFTLNTGGTVAATYASGSGSATLRFNYTVVAGNNDPDGIILISPLNLNGGTIRDASSNNASLTYSIPSTTGVLVDGIAPTISSVTTAATGNYNTGATITFTATFSEAVTVSGTPRIQINLNSGGPAFATYSAGSGSTTLTFAYSVVAGHTDNDGITVVSPLGLNGGTISDIVTNNAILTFTPPSTTSITINAGSPILTISPSSHNYGSVGGAVDQSFTMSNTGLVTSGALATSFTFPTTNSYVVKSNNCTGTLAVGASCTIVITFRANNGTVPNGTHTATLSVSDGTVSSNTVNISGTKI